MSRVELFHVNPDGSPETEDIVSPAAKSTALEKDMGVIATFGSKVPRSSSTFTYWLSTLATLKYIVFVTVLPETLAALSVQVYVPAAGGVVTVEGS